jgi:hypothetical protein
MLGISQMSNEELMNLDLEGYARALNVDLLSGEEVIGNKAQEYFTRNADRLPLTLSVFSRPEFVQLQGKQVNPITVLNSLNQTGIKQIEKDLIKKVIEDNYQGQKKISYDELEAIVRANIMPLERIFTSSYSDYGMNNLGDGNYGNANTIILNSPIEHGVTGHFSGDFKASNRTNIKYVPKQLNDNTWVAVEEGYESQANDNNIYQYVGTAGTKEAVDEWIIKYNLSKGIIYDNKKYLVYQDAFDQKDNILPLAGFNTEQEAKDYIEKNKDNYTYNLDYVDRQYLQDNWNLENTNKGMFGHIRVWQDGETFIVAELQSDYFQKQYVVEDLTQQTINSKEHSFTQEQKNEYNSIFRDMQKYRKDYFEERDRVKVFDTLSEATKENLNNLKKTYEEKKQQYEKEVVSKARPLFDAQEKQFIASQKEWEKRMVREAIKEASLSGATQLRFPTPYTLSVIEGYVTIGEEDKAKTKLRSAMEGEIVDYLDTEYIVEYTDIPNGGTEVTIRPVRDFTKISYDAFQDMIEEEGEPDTYVESYDGEFVYYTNSLYGSSETIDTKDVSATKEDFSIENDLSDIQQTVARKYEEIADILKQERGEENVEIITDENGFDWYETKIESSEVNNPVVAFQKQELSDEDFIRLIEDNGIVEFDEMCGV